MTDSESYYLAYLSIFFLTHYNDTIVFEKYGFDEHDAYKALYDLFRKKYDVDLDIEDETIRNILFDFSKTIFRYKQLNDNLKNAIEYFNNKEESSYIKDNFDLIIDIISDEFNEIVGMNNYEERALPYLSHEDLDKYFTEFLSVMDKSGTYNKIYEDIKDKIIYLDTKTKEEKDEIIRSFGYDPEEKEYDNLFQRVNDKGYILLTRKENIDDMRNLAHEFIHYVTFLYNKDINLYSIDIEFPSMFYENLAVNFLSSKGYSLDDIENSVFNRFKYIYDQSSIISNVNCYLEMYKNTGGHITFEDDLAFRKRQIENYKKIIGKDRYDYLIESGQEKEFDPAIVAGDLCDYANGYMTINQDILTLTYPYIIGHYLACRYVKEGAVDPSILEEMVYITKNLPNIPKEQLIYKEEHKKNKQ